MEVIVTHRNADFDALASLVAASVLYPEAKAVLPSSLNSNVKAFVSIHKDLFPFVEKGVLDPGSLECLIMVDTAQVRRVEGCADLLESDGLRIHIWDHHDAPEDVTPHMMVKEPVGAATTLLVERLDEDRVPISPMQATLFLAGIYEDTGNLMFPGTTARDARAAAYLLEQEADLNVLKNFLRPAYGPKQKEILFRMLQNVHRGKLNGYRVSINKVPISGHTPGLATVVDMYQDIVNVDAAFGIFTDEETGRTMVIGRSEHEGLDVGRIMRSMGGGGHPGAGSALLKNVQPEAVESWLVELVEGNQHSSVRIGDLMSFPVTTVAPETPMKDAAVLLRRTGCTGLPVVEGKRIVGVISRRDFRKIKREKQLEAPVKAFMSTKVVSIDPGRSAMEAARKMIKHDVGRLPVVQDGELIGILTRSDTMRYFYDMLPE